jgi:hypothetical protein
MNGLNRPIRRVSYKTKTEDDFNYCKQWIDWIEGQAVSGLYSSKRVNKLNSQQIEENYDLYYQLANGYIPKDWFTYITNSFNFGKDKTLGDKSLPSKIDDFNVVYSTLSYLEGKKNERPFNWQVENIAHTASTKKQEDVNLQIKAELEKLWNEDEDASASPVDFEKKIEGFINRYKDSLAEEGQDIMTYALQKDKTREKLIECFKHWLIVGEAYMRMDVEKDEVKTLPISPKYIDYHVGANDYEGKYIEDADWVRVEYEMSPVEIIDTFSHLLTAKEIDEIEKCTTDYARLNVLFNYNFYDDRRRTQDKQRVLHCQWKVFKKTYRVTYPNPFTGEEEEMIADEDFKLTNELVELGFKAQEEWIIEVWEGWKINKNYIGIRPLPIQTGKLSYYGRKFRNLHAYNTSIVHMALPYIKLFCVLWFKLQLVVAKSQGRLALIPIDLMTGQEGSEEWTFEKKMYIAQSLGMILYDKSKLEKGETLANYVGNTEISQFNDATTLINLLEYVKQSWLNMVGLSPSALAQQTSDKGLGVTQNELYQSSVITEPIFTQFEYFEERLLQGILDYSKYAYIKGKRGTVVRDDSSIAYLNVDGTHWANADLGIFITRSGEESRRLEAMRQLAMELGSQGQDPSKLAEIIYANNSAKLLGILHQLKEMEVQQAQQQAESEEKLKQETIQIQQAYKQFEVEMEIEKARGIAEAEFPYKKELELIKLEANQLSFQGDLDTNTNGIPDVNEVEKRSNERLKMNIDAKLKVAELNLKNKEIESKERTEQLKAKIAIKNKVSGEK